jgi:hypothetical protein
VEHNLSQLEQFPFDFIARLHATIWITNNTSLSRSWIHIFI